MMMVVMMMMIYLFTCNLYYGVPLTHRAAVVDDRGTVIGHLRRQHTSPTHLATHTVIGHLRVAVQLVTGI